jgi:hypothetical protein
MMTRQRVWALALAMMIGSGSALAADLTETFWVVRVGDGFIKVRDSSDDECKPGLAPKMTLYVDSADATAPKQDKLDSLYCRKVSLRYEDTDRSHIVLKEVLGVETTDERRTFGATFYTGLGIDTFAANELSRYLNPEDSGGLRERGVAGFDFEYRLIGKPEDSRQFWVYGETVHGVRSADVDCEKNPGLPVCEDFDPTNPGPALAILRNATSLEAMLGLRFEFAKLAPDSESPSRAYLSLQAGFLTVAGNGGDVVDMHEVALGVTATGGRYRGSFLQAGFGRSDLYLDKAKDRWKIDGLLQWHPAAWQKAGAAPFVELVVDADAGSGSDSVQTYVGVDFDLDRFFPGKK